MKKMLLIEYWLVILSWCICLNGHTVTADLLILTVSTCLLMLRSEAQLWRMTAVMLGESSVMLGLFLAGNISCYFPDLYGFLALLALNSAVCNEYLCLAKKEELLCFLLVALAAAGLMMAAITIVPDELYTLFTKGSLYLMAAFIFLPYLIPLLWAYAWKRYACRRSIVRLTPVVHK